MKNQLQQISITNRAGQEIGTYTEVSERVQAFRSSTSHVGWAIISEEIPVEEKGHVKFKAIIVDENDRIRSTGHATESISNNTMVNQFSAVENCETSAIGRALGFLGFGLTASIASAEEIISNVTKLFDFAIQGLKDNPSKESIDYAKKRLKDTDFDEQQRKALMKAVNEAKVKNTTT